jgi:hypothetical protein
MSDDKLPATGFKTDWAEAAQRAARAGESVQARGQAGTTTQRTVGVYERPSARRAKLSLPMIVILILVSLISLVLSARFLFCEDRPSPPPKPRQALEKGSRAEPNETHTGERKERNRHRPRRLAWAH